MRKDDKGKPRWSLLPWGALSQIVDVLEYGAEKYAPHAWANVPDGQQRYLDALLRHVAEMAQGEWRDSESRLPHAAHVACNALFLLVLRERDDVGAGVPSSRPSTLTL